jgi:hypothetical protein
MEFGMPDKSKEEHPPKRHNRAVGLSDALKGVLDSALKKRGFATRDVITHWAVMAPKPYDRLAMPEQLKWPRGAGHEGATLYLRCAPGHALALSHEGALIASAVNRYFGYFLVREVRLSAEPFSANSAPKAEAPALSPEIARQTQDTVAGVKDEALRDALGSLGNGLLNKRPR